MAKLTLFYESRTVNVHPLDESETLIGRSSECNLVIDDPAVAFEHALIYRDGERFMIIPAQGDAEVLVNNEPAREHALEHGDLIKIGRHILGYSTSAVKLQFRKAAAVSGQETHEAADGKSTALDSLVKTIDTLPSGCIQVLTGRHVGKILRLQRSLMRLTMRPDECAVIAHRDDGYYLSHLEGETAPLVNGRSIGERSTRLKEGDIIQSGPVKMRFHEESITRAAG
ncbi:MAG: FHA domain-containing protein [Sedimenticola sp.]